MKTKTFNTIYNNAFNNITLRSGDYKEAYEIFITYLIPNEAWQEKQFFIMSWRHSAQRELLSYCSLQKQQTVKQFLKQVYDAYIAPKPE
jgi:hypothetical protein